MSASSCFRVAAVSTLLFSLAACAGSNGEETDSVGSSVFGKKKPAEPLAPIEMAVDRDSSGHSEELEDDLDEIQPGEAGLYFIPSGPAVNGKTPYISVTRQEYDVWRNRRKK